MIYSDVVAAVNVMYFGVTVHLYFYCRLFSRRGFALLMKHRCSNSGVTTGALYEEEEVQGYSTCAQKHYFKSNLQEPIWDLNFLENFRFLENRKDDIT